jgi:hypothetical protein
VTSLETSRFMACDERCAQHALVRVLPAGMPARATVRVDVEEVGDRYG